MMFLCLAAPAYPTAGAPQYPQQGKRIHFCFLEKIDLVSLGYGVDKPQAPGAKKR